MIINKSLKKGEIAYLSSLFCYARLKRKKNVDWKKKSNFDVKKKKFNSKENWKEIAEQK